LHLLGGDLDAVRVAGVALGVEDPVGGGSPAAAVAALAFVFGFRLRISCHGCDSTKTRLAFRWHPRGRSQSAHNPCLEQLGA
jgi:hypothetical protein